MRLVLVGLCTVQSAPEIQTFIQTYHGNHATSFLINCKMWLCVHITRAYRGTGDKTLHILNLGSGCGCDEASRFDYWTPRVGCRSSLWQLQYSLLYFERVSDGQWQRTLNVSFIFRIFAIHTQPAMYLGRGCQCWGCQLLGHVAKLHMWQSVQLHVLYLLWLPEFSVAASICFAERYWQDCLRSPTHIKTTRQVTKLEPFYQTYYIRGFWDWGKRVYWNRMLKWSRFMSKDFDISNTSFRFS